MKVFRVADTQVNMQLYDMGLILVVITGCGWPTNATFCDKRPPRVPISALQSFSSYVDNNYEWYQHNCFAGIAEKLSISSLDEYISRWKTSNNPDCRSMYAKFSGIYSVNKVSGQLVIPETFQTQVLKWLGNDEALLQRAKLQSITTVFNQYTHESSIFNPLRSMRPGVNTDEDLDEYVEELNAQTEKNCDFCQYKHKTAEDTFGRIDSEHSVTAANAFKYDAFHALVLFKTHHPLIFSEEQFMDFMNTAMAWFLKVHTVDKQYRYPHLMWDLLPKAGASQLHPHAQISLNAVRYYGLMEHIRLAAMQYRQEHDGQNYFSNLLQIHSALGLTTTLGIATAMAHLAPKKDHEIIILSKTPTSEFFRLVYYTIRAFIDDLRMYALSLAIFLPDLDPSTTDNDNIPAIFRIITRGPPTFRRSDISANELFGASYVNTDPFSLIQHIGNSVKSRSQQQTKEHLKQQPTEK